MLAGLPDDFAGTAPAGALKEPPKLTFEFDGHYVGTLQPETGTLAHGVEAAEEGEPAPESRLIRRDMLVVDGRATFGTNLPFTGLVAPDGGIEMRYGDLGTLAGRFAGATFSGILSAGADPANRWSVRLQRVVVAPPVEDPRPMQVDMQPHIGG